MIYVLKSDTELIGDNKEFMRDVSILQLLEIAMVPFVIDKELLESWNSILITSKNAIKALQQHELAEEFLKKPAIVIGEASKRAWLHAGGDVLFCPDVACNGVMLAGLIRDIVKNQHVLYPCAKEKATDMTLLLEDVCNVHEVIVYESRECEMLYRFCGSSNSLERVYDNALIDLASNTNTFTFVDESVFIFGSPKHYKAFIKRYGWNKTWVAISLGETTYAHFDEDMRKLNAKGDFTKALMAAQAMRNDTPMQDNRAPRDLEDCTLL